jgi:hypothetical protein
MDLLFLPIFEARFGVEVISADPADGAAGDKWYSDVSWHRFNK